MNYECAKKAIAIKDNISYVTLAVSKKNNDFITDVNVVEQTILERTEIDGKLYEINRAQMLINIKVNEEKYTAFLLYSNLDELAKEIKRNLPTVLFHGLKVEVV